MNPKTQPLPIIFAVATLWMAAVVGIIQVTLGVRDPVAYVVVALGAVGVGALLTVVAARQRQRERLGTLSEPTRYRIAIHTGQVSGDVSRWPAWIRRDLKLTIVTVIGGAFIPAMLGVLLCFLAAVGAAVHPWSVVPLVVVSGVVVSGVVVSGVVVSGVVVGQQWRIRRRLKDPGEKLCAPAAAAGTHRA